MILDALTQLSDAQAVTSADAYSTNTIDLGATTPVRQIGDGEPLALVVSVDVAAAGDGTPASFTDTFDFILVESANANLSSHTEVIKRRVPGAQLTAGAVVIIPIPPGKPTKRYIGARYELGTDDTITVSAFIAPMSFVQVMAKAYAKGYVID
jgi:hypothetical protein